MVGLQAKVLRSGGLEPPPLFQGRVLYLPIARYLRAGELFRVLTPAPHLAANVLAICARIRLPAAAKLGVGPQPLYCPWPRCFRCIPHSSLLARPSLCALSALRGTSADATMTTPGGASTLPPLENILELLQSSAHRLLS